MPLDIDEGAAATRAAADRAIGRLTADTRHALKYIHRSANSIEFTVPDRDGDEVPETLRYSWGGTAGDPLVRRLNGGSAYVVLQEVHNFSLTYAERMVPAVDVTIEPDPKWPVVESFSLLSLTASSASLDLPLPTGVAEGELLVTAVVVDRNEASNLVGPLGWSLLNVSQEGGKVTLGVWWRLATAVEPTDYRWQWGGNRKGTRLDGPHFQSVSRDSDYDVHLG